MAGEVGVLGDGDNQREFPLLRDLSLTQIFLHSLRRGQGMREDLLEGMQQSKGEMYSEMCLLDMLWVSLKKKSWDWGSSLGRKKPAVIGESKRG